MRLAFSIGNDVAKQVRGDYENSLIGCYFCIKNKYLKE